MSFNQKLTERLAIIGTIDPASLSATTHLTDVIDMQNFRRVVFILLTGALGTNATLDFEVNGDTAANGTFATQIEGKDITQIVKATGDNIQAAVEVMAEEVAHQGLRYIRGELAVGTAASLGAVLVLGEFLRYSDASEHDLESVAELV